MKIRIVALAAVLLLVLSIPTYAAVPYSQAVQPQLSFSGTTANCSVNYTKAGSSDYVSLTLTLYQGSSYVDSWSASGTNRVRISETCEVERGKTYRLVLTWSVNGQAQAAVSTTGTCP